MELILVVCLVFVLAYIAAQVHRFGQATEKLLELAENAMMTRGGVFPAFSRYEIMKEMQLLTESGNRLRKLDVPYVSEEYLGMFIRSGKGWRDLKQDIGQFRDARCVHEMHEETYNKMVSSNLEVFSGKKTIGQAKSEVKELQESYSDFGRRWVELSREEDKYLLWVRARFDKVESEVAKYPERRGTGVQAREGNDAGAEGVHHSPVDIGNPLEGPAGP